MTTILTVHGTGATGAESGEKWWQKGSPFEASMREMVETDDEELAWQPVIWDGANSETSRRAAGKQLYAKMLALEERGEPYSVIGHSHSGSVISAALIEAAGEKNELQQMKNWLTVGTPFIETQKERFLFSRLGTMGKAAYIALLTGFLMLSVTLALEIGRMDSVDNASIVVATVVGITLPFVLIYLLVLYDERCKMHLYSRNSLKFAGNTYGLRWLSLWHRNDEAVQGLKSLKALKIDIFSNKFAVAPLGFLSVLVLPVLLLVLVTSPEIMKELEEGIAKTSYGIKLDSLVGMNLDSNSASSSAKYVTELVAGGGIILSHSIISNTGTTLQSIVGILIIIIYLIVIMLAVSLLITIFGNSLAKIISYFISKRLNPLTMNQIKGTLLGSDAVKEIAVDAQHWPMWLDEGHPPLPEALSNNLQAHSDAAAAKAIPKFRGAATSFAMARDDQEKTDMLSEYLTWDELIHTSYFTNPYFCKLVAYGLIQGEGFRATPAFLQDKYYASAGKWHREIVGANASASAY